MILSKVPPHAKDLEKAILGAIVIEKDAITQVYEILNESMFYVDAHALIYKAIAMMYEKNKHIDMLTIIEQLRINGDLEIVGGVYFISELTNTIASSANILTHALIVRQKYIQRKEMNNCIETYNKLSEDIEDVFAVIDEHQMKIEELLSHSITTANTADYIFAKIKKSLLEDKPIGKLIKSELGLDFLTKTLNVVAGFQGTGKTAMLLTLAMEFAEKNKVAVMSLEMSAEMLTARLIQQKSGVYAKNIISNTLYDKYKERVFEIESLSENIIVDDNTNVTDANIIGKIKTLKNRYKVEIVFIDYVQIIDLSGRKNDTYVARMSKLCRYLQMIAKNLDICIIILSQLARSNEIPNAQSLRGGGIEQDASNIYILYDKHWKNTNDVPPHEKDIINVINAKDRYGICENSRQGSSFDLYFNKNLQLFQKAVFNETFKQSKNEDMF